jgi:hypothetical protein
VFTLQNTAKDFGIEISLEKSQMFLGKDQVRCKIIVDNKCLKQVKNLKYLGCETSNENEKDVQQKLANFSQILRILSNTFERTWVQKSSRIKI